MRREPGAVARPGNARLSIAGLCMLGFLLGAGPLASRVDAGVTGSPHDFSGTGPYAKTLGKGGACSPCHVPHNALDNVLWPRSLSGYRDRLTGWDGNPSSEKNFLHNSTDAFRAATLQCYDCHDYHATTEFETPASIPEVGAGKDFSDAKHYPQNILSGFKKSGLSSPTMQEDGFGSGSNFKIPGYFENNPPTSGTYGVSDNTPLAQTGGHYFKTDPTDGSNDSLKAGDKLACNLCHDPHAWKTDGTWQAFFRRFWPYQTDPNSPGTRLGSAAKASGDMANEGTQMPSPGSWTTVARDNEASRELCTACHGLADGTMVPVTFKQIRSDFKDNQITGMRTGTAASIDEHKAASQAPCTSCHKHYAISASCSQCHGFPPAPGLYAPDLAANPQVTGGTAYPSAPRDPHPLHFGKYDNGVAASIYSFECRVCHATSSLGSRPADVHNKGTLNVAYDFSAFPGVANPPDNVSAGGMTCSNVYCHSYGGSDNGITGYFASPKWGTTPGPLPCNACHGRGTDNNAVQTGMPDYHDPAALPGSPGANSHGAHVLRASTRYECTKCHAGTAQGTYTNRTIKASPLLHVNGLREVSFDNTSWSYSGVTGNQTNDKRCDVMCHGTGKPVEQRPQWGGTLSCDGCLQSQGAGKQSKTYSGVHQSHTDNSAYNFACEVCHAAKASARPNTVHVSGDNSATSRYVEVLFTDNASLQSYDNTGSFRSFGMFSDRYGVAWSPAYVDNGVPGGTDNINSSITWSRGSCTNVWCHSNANPVGGTNVRATPAWEAAATGSCTVCHRGPDSYASMSAATGAMSRGHWKHLDNTAYRLACDECHADTAAANSATAILSPGGYAKHVDGAKDVKGGTGIRLTAINDNSLVYSGSRTCTATYCHSAGVDNNAAGGFDNSVESPAWGTGTTGCTSCHGGTIASGTPISTGKHLEHLQEGYRCSNCHSLTVAADSDNVIRTAPDGTGKTGYDYHVNGVKDYVAGDGFSFTQGSCNNISCHGGGSSTWTAPPLGCGSCHLSNAADNDYYLSGVDNLYAGLHPPNIDNTEWVHSGHGKPSGNYDVTNFPAANFPGGVTGSGDQCGYCHDDTVTHNTAANPFRLKVQTGVAGYGSLGWNATCLVCHSKNPTPPGYDPDGTGTIYAKRVAASSFADNSHFGSEHTAAYNGGKFCWDCHDPHGDRKSGGPGNIYMVQKGQLARQTDNTYGIRGSGGALTTNAPVFTGNASGTSYADNTTYLGICQVCHTQGTTGHYRHNYGDGHNATTRCTQCHKHDAAFSPSDCKGCHGGSGGLPQVGAAGAPLITRYWKSSGHGSDNAAAKYGRAIECEDCHDLNMQSGEGTHEANNTTGTAPNNINTEDWLNKSPRNSFTNPNVNTSHLVPAYIGSGGDAAKAQTFDDACYTLCHSGKGLTDHRHTKGTAMEFGKRKTTTNPKQYQWYSQAAYDNDFYRSWSPWVIQDITTSLYLPSYSPYYGTCVSCHDPHGTGTTDTSRVTWRGTFRTNHMVRGNWISDGNGFCNTACHRQP